MAQKQRFCSGLKLLSASQTWCRKLRAVNGVQVLCVLLRQHLVFHTSPCTPLTKVTWVYFCSLPLKEPKKKAKNKKHEIHKTRQRLEYRQVKLKLKYEFIILTLKNLFIQSLHAWQCALMLHVWAKDVF